MLQVRIIDYVVRSGPLGTTAIPLAAFPGIRSYEPLLPASKTEKLI